MIINSDAWGTLKNAFLYRSLKLCYVNILPKFRTIISLFEFAVSLVPANCRFFKKPECYNIL